MSNPKIYEVAKITDRIKDLQLDLKKAEGKYKNALSLVSREIERLGGRIKRGTASTFDDITDFCVYAYQSVRDEIAQPFRDIEALMAGMNGQLFLVIERARVSGEKSFGNYGFYLEPHYFLGLLTEEKFLFDLARKTYALPTRMFVEFMSVSPPYLMSGPFDFRTHSIHALGHTIHGGKEFGIALEVIIGDAAVSAYVPPEASNQLEEWSIARNKAMRLLGRKVPKSPKEKKADKEARENVLLSLKNMEGNRRLTRRLYDASPSDDLERKIRRLGFELKSLINQAKRLGFENDRIVRKAITHMEKDP